MQLATHQKEEGGEEIFIFLAFMTSFSSGIPPGYLKGILQVRINRGTSSVSELTLSGNTCKLNVSYFVNHLFCLYWVFKGKCDNPTVLYLLSRVFNLIKLLQLNGLKQHGAPAIGGYL